MCKHGSKQARAVWVTSCEKIKGLVSKLWDHAGTFWNVKNGTFCHTNLDSALWANNGIFTLRADSAFYPTRYQESYLRITMMIIDCVQFEKLGKCDGSGILAADESTGTMGKRLANCGLENTEDNRQFIISKTPRIFRQFIILKTPRIPGNLSSRKHRG